MKPLRIGLLSYRAHPEVGGQGVYVRSLSAALTRAGHEVTVLAGPPYPELDPGVELVRVPSLDLYRADDPFRRPAREEFRSLVDAYEYAVMCTGAFPEPMTFSVRVAQLLKEQRHRFDVIHDNQGLGYGSLAIKRMLPLVTTIHHPISVDRRLALAGAPNRAKRVGQRRWYSFVRMQARVARRLPLIVTVSESAREDVIADFGVDPGKVDVVHNGVDADLFRPLPDVRPVPGRLITIASSDLPSKGLGHLVEAVAKLRTERDVELVVVGRGGQSGALERAVDRFGIGDSVRTVGRVDALELVRLFAESEVAVVPSLYEGFSLPAVEAMSCGVPLVATTGGALREVVGDAGCLVPPADAGAMATAIAGLLDDPERRRQLAKRARERVLERFTWSVAATEMVERYERVIASC